MTVLFFIVLPLATILISIVLQKVLKNPFLVAILVFSVYLILAFTAFTTDFLINTIIYTVIAFITAVITKIICCLLKKLGCHNTCDCDNDDDELEEAVESLQESISNLENNINNLNDLISNLIGNNNCGCNNRRIR